MSNVPTSRTAEQAESDAPRCLECGNPWGVVAPTTPLYPLGVIGHYCGPAGRITREPLTIEEVALVIASEQASREHAQRLKEQYAREREQMHQETAARLLAELEQSIDGTIARLSSGEPLNGVDRRWATFALGAFWADLKASAKR